MLALLVSLGAPQENTQERFRELIFRCVTQLTAGKEELAS